MTTLAAADIASLEAEVLAHPALRHPFLDRFALEPLSAAQLKSFGLQHFQLVRIFTTYMTNLMARMPACSAALRPVLDDEFGGHSIFRSHVHLYREFLSGLGLRDADWGAARLEPETRGFIDAHLELTRSGDVFEALGAIGPGHELSIPVMFRRLVAGLRRSGALRAGALHYFTEHISQDQHHREAFNSVIREHAVAESEFARVRRGALRSLDLRGRFWDGCSRAVFGAERQLPSEVRSAPSPCRGGLGAGG